MSSCKKRTKSDVTNNVHIYVDQFVIHILTWIYVRIIFLKLRKICANLVKNMCAKIFLECIRAKFTDTLINIITFNEKKKTILHACLSTCSNRIIQLCSIFLYAACNTNIFSHMNFERMQNFCFGLLTLFSLTYWYSLAGCVLFYKDKIIF